MPPWAIPGSLDNLVDAISAEHAIALVEPHPAVIDTTTLVAAVRFDLGGVDPAMAKAIPNVASGQIKLPKAQIPLARQARTFANRWVGWLSLGALLGFVLAFLLGEPARAAAGGGLGARRRAGVGGDSTADHGGGRRVGQEPGGGGQGHRARGAPGR